MAGASVGLADARGPLGVEPARVGGLQQLQFLRGKFDGSFDPPYAALIAVARCVAPVMSLICTSRVDEVMSTSSLLARFGDGPSDGAGPSVEPAASSAPPALARASGPCPPLDS
eukprot:4895204-Pyramimonas_sp.AAC.1